MERDASKLAARGGRILFTDMRRGAGIEDVVAFIEETGGLGVPGRRIAAGEGSVPLEIRQAVEGRTQRVRPAFGNLPVIGIGRLDRAFRIPW
jgi:hypothetical protein